MVGLHQTSFNTKSVFFHFPERLVYEVGSRQRAEEKKSPAPSGIRTHELLTSSHVVYHFATYNNCLHLTIFLHSHMNKTYLAFSVILISALKVEFSLYDIRKLGRFIQTHTVFYSQKVTA